MRDGPTLSCEGPAEELASVIEAVTDYLPQAFVDCLLDSALEPVLDAAVKRGRQAAKRKKNSGDAEEIVRALLAVTVCDPACDSGSLLVAAARRIVRRVAEAREGNLSPDALRRAMREVVGSCIYGVDVSCEAVERTKDRLRLAADVPGMTPPFLDGRVRQGNALIGASPDLIESGIPDEAFRAADGDNRGYARSLRRANAKPDPGQATLFSEQGGYSHSNEALAKSLARIGGCLARHRLPRAVAADSLPLMLPRVVPPFAAALIASQSSLVFDYVARQKIDGPTVRAAQWRQLPVPTPSMLEPHLPFIVPRVLELVYTAPDMSPLARDLDDRSEDPFAWDPDRRVNLRAELDAFFFRAYGVNDRDDVEYITDTLQTGADGLEQGKSQDDDGGRHAKELILAAYDRMAEACAAGAEYETRIFPPPGHGPRHRSF